MVKKSMFEAALDMAEPLVASLPSAVMRNATPCERWTVYDVLNHMLNELAWVPEMLVGKTIAQVGHALDGDLVGDDVVHAWRMYADAARKIILETSPDKVVHLSYGNVPARNYLDEVGTDLIVHSWDVAKGSGQTLHIDDATAEIVYEHTKNNIASWRRAGLVGEEISVPAAASAEEKLLGLFGRRLDWRPPHNAASPPAEN